MLPRRNAPAAKWFSDLEKEAPHLGDVILRMLIRGIGFGAVDIQLFVTVAVLRYRDSKSSRKTKRRPDSGRISSKTGAHPYISPVPGTLLRIPLTSCQIGQTREACSAWRVTQSVPMTRTTIYSPVDTDAVSTTSMGQRTKISSSGALLNPERLPLKTRGLQRGTY